MNPFAACVDRESHSVVEGESVPLRYWRRMHKNVGSLRFSEVITDDTIAMMKKFVCEMYGMKRYTSVNEVRLELFPRKYKPKTGEKISCVKKMDGSYLPPYLRVVKQKIKRTNLIAGKWLSLTSVPPPPPPGYSTRTLRMDSKCGWALQN